MTSKISSPSVNKKAPVEKVKKAAGAAPRPTSASYKAGLSTSALASPEVASNISEILKNGGDQQELDDQSMLIDSLYNPPDPKRIVLLGTQGCGKTALAFTYIQMDWHEDLNTVLMSHSSHHHHQQNGSPQTNGSNGSSEVTEASSSAATSNVSVNQETHSLQTTPTTSNEVEQSVPVVNSMMIEKGEQEKSGNSSEKDENRQPEEVSDTQQETTPGSSPSSEVCLSGKNEQLTPVSPLQGSTVVDADVLRELERLREENAQLRKSLQESQENQAKAEKQIATIEAEREELRTMWKQERNSKFDLEKDMVELERAIEHYKFVQQQLEKALEYPLPPVPPVLPALPILTTEEVEKNTAIFVENLNNEDVQTMLKALQDEEKEKRESQGQLTLTSAVSPVESAAGENDASPQHTPPPRRVSLHVDGMDNGSPPVPSPRPLHTLLPKIKQVDPYSEAFRASQSPADRTRRQPNRTPTTFRFSTRFAAPIALHDFSSEDVQMHKTMHEDNELRELENQLARTPPQHKSVTELIKASGDDTTIDSNKSSASPPTSSPLAQALQSNLIPSENTNEEEKNNESNTEDDIGSEDCETDTSDAPSSLDNNTSFMPQEGAVPKHALGIIDVNTAPNTPGSPMLSESPLGAMDARLNVTPGSVNVQQTLMNVTSPDGASPTTSCIPPPPPLPPPIDIKTFTLLQSPMYHLLEGIRMFNKEKQKDAIKYLIENNVIKEDPTVIASFLAQTANLSKTKLGEYLGAKENLLILKQYCEYHMRKHYKGLSFEMALRAFLTLIKLPVEGQVVERIAEEFAISYANVHPNGEIKEENNPFLLTCAILMLNTDAHNPLVKNKMTKPQFLSILETTNLSQAYLSTIYDSIKNYQLKIVEEEQLDEDDPNYIAPANPSLASSKSVLDIQKGAVQRKVSSVSNNVKRSASSIPLTNTSPSGTTTSPDVGKKPFSAYMVYKKKVIIDRKVYTFNIKDADAVGDVTDKDSISMEIMDKEIQLGDLFLCVYSVTDMKSFERAQAIIERIIQLKEAESFQQSAKKKSSKATGSARTRDEICQKIILVGCKSDANPDEREVSFKQGASLAIKLGVPFFEASSMQHKNVKELFFATYNQILRQFQRKKKEEESQLQAEIKKAAKKDRLTFAQIIDSARTYI